MVLSREDIINCVASGDIIIEPSSGKYEPASYDMRVGKWAAKQEGSVDLSEKKTLSVHRGEIVVIKPLERIELKNKVVARYGLRSKYARQGLILLSGPQIKPGWRGYLTVTVFNAGSSTVHLDYGDTFAEIEFSRLDTEARDGYDGPNQDQKETIDPGERDLATADYSTIADIDMKQRSYEANQNIVFGFIIAVVFGVVTGVIMNVMHVDIEPQLSISFDYSKFFKLAVCILALYAGINIIWKTISWFMSQFRRRR